RAARATARAVLEEGLALARVGRWRQSMIWGIHGLGLVAFFEQDYGTARSYFEDGLTLCGQLGNRTFAAFSLEGLAMTVAAQGQPARAAQLCGAAHRLRQTINAAVPAFVRPIYERLVMNLQAQLGEEAYRALWEQGQAMTIEQVMRVGKTAGIFSPGGEEKHQL
ncbi:MAG TPA: hypothetical protein VKR06_37290, partial [Ktedonosporobacter sp.]|nr:hypothetical protein [Ktedonosporobacter sp.]